MGRGNKLEFSKNCIKRLLKYQCDYYKRVFRVYLAIMDEGM